MVQAKNRKKSEKPSEPLVKRKRGRPRKEKPKLPSDLTDPVHPGIEEELPLLGPLLEGKSTMDQKLSAETYYRRVKSRLELVRLAKLKGDLVPKKLTRDLLTERAGEFNRSLMNLAGTHAQELADEDDPRAVKEHLLEAFRSLLEDYTREYPGENR